VKEFKLFFILWACLSIIFLAAKMVYSYGAWCPVEPRYYTGEGNPECESCHLTPVDCNLYYFFCVDGAESDCADCHADQVAYYCNMAPYLTVTATGGSSGGSILPSDSFEVEPYSDVTLTFTPTVGYQVEDVLVTGTILVTGEGDIQYYNTSFGPVRHYTISNIIGNHLIEATFAALPPCVGDPVQMGATYPSPQIAYDDIEIGSSETIGMQSRNFGEDLILDRDVDVILKGGYDCDFYEPPVSFSAIRSMTISDGTVSVENIILTE